MPLPAALLDDLHWDELFEEGRDRIPAHAPEWTDHNVHDPGITILDLLAFVTEQTAFRIDQIPDRHRARFAALLGEEARIATPATAIVQLTATVGEHDIPAETVMVAQTETDSVPFVTDRPVRATVARIASLSSAHAELPIGEPFSPLGLDGVATLTIRLEPPAPAGALSLWVESIDEPPGPPTARHHSVELQWQVLSAGTWLDLPRSDVVDGTVSFTRSGFVDLDLPTATALRCAVRSGRYDRAPRLARIVPNAVAATQTSRRALTRVRPSKLRLDLGSRNVQEVKLTSNRGPWEVRRAPRREPNRPVALFAPATGTLHFSDGRWGRRPLDDETFDVQLLDSMGRDGNVTSAATWSLSAFPDVRGHARSGARSGAPAETAIEAVSRAAGSLWAHERLALLATAHDATSLDGLARVAVDETLPPGRAATSLDYERLALATPGVRLARARAWTDLDVAVPCAQAPGTVSVVVVPHLPAGQPAPNPQLVGEVRDFLAARKTLGTRLQVRGPDYTEVSIRATVAPVPGADPAALASSVDAAIRRFLDPLQGGPDRRGWPFGRDVYRTEIMAAAGEVSGVDLVTDVVLGGEKGCANLCVPPTHLVSVESLTVEVAP